MKKADREKIFNKFEGRCAYCGCQLGRKWQADHIVPIYHNDTQDQWEKRITHGARKADIPRGTNEIENYNPACHRCNGWKSTMDIETFRNEIGQQVRRARAYSCNFRMAEDFGLIKETGIEVKFYFETVNIQS